MSPFDHKRISRCVHARLQDVQAVAAPCQMVFRSLRIRAVLAGPPEGSDPALNAMGRWVAASTAAWLAEVKAEIRRRRCLPIPEQGRWLAAVVRGHQAYYAVPGNSDAVNAFRTQVIRHWRKALRRRSQRTRITWARMNRIATRWIPPTRTVHPFPQARFAATHPR